MARYFAEDAQDITEDPVMSIANIERLFTEFALVHTVRDPVSVGVMLYAGAVLNDYLARWLRSAGMDYVTVTD